MRIYLTGASGMLGRALAEAVAEGHGPPGTELHGVGGGDFDIADARALEASVAAFAPDAIVHTAADAVVDSCERDPGRAVRTNVTGTANVAEAARRSASRLVYLSSDYVFDGRSAPDGGYREDDPPAPLSVYGLTKLAGERIAAHVPAHTSVRTSWLFGGDHEDLDAVLATLRGAERGSPARLVHDQRGSPTYTRDLAEALLYVLALPDPPNGVLNIANAGAASWYEVGRHVLAAAGPGGAGPPVPVAMDDLGHLGARPRFSALDCSTLARLGHPLPPWQDAAERYCRRIRSGVLR